jgi:hypothetical protein
MGPVPRRIEGASWPDLEVIHTETHMNRRQLYGNLKKKISLRDYVTKNFL